MGYQNGLGLQVNVGIDDSSWGQDDERANPLLRISPAQSDLIKHQLRGMSSNGCTSFVLSQKLNPVVHEEGENVSV